MHVVASDHTDAYRISNEHPIITSVKASPPHEPMLSCRCLLQSQSLSATNEGPPKDEEHVAMTPIRTIIYLDLDAFFCAVEERRDPILRGTAFAVRRRPQHRGVVASCSYAARQFVVHSAMPMAQAVQLCPDLLIVPPQFAAYRATSQQVMQRLHQLTPLVEQISIDEAFLDVTALGEPGDVLAAQLQATIQNDLALS